MLILDDLLLAPAHGVLWVVKKIHAAVIEEVEAQHARITSDLSELYMMLDTGKITEEEFDKQEKQLLDRLDSLEAIK